MAVKCTECGASIQDDSKFCRYCGAKIVDENLKKIEVKIDNTAEIKRAGYEEQESLLRQKMMKRELRMKGLKWKICGSLFLLGFLMVLPYIISGDVMKWPGIVGAILLCGIPSFIFLDWVAKLGR